MTDNHGALVPQTAGIVLHRIVPYYDMMVSLMTHGRERAFRDNLVSLAHVKRGDWVLDAGCGTGSLALAAKRHAGSEGCVWGIDASPEMIAAAKRKALKAGLEIIFQNAVIEALPFKDATFDVVMSTLMFHHLPRKAREMGVTEMRRVLKPSGRLLVVDFGSRQPRQTGLLARIHHGHGHISLSDVIAMLDHAGLNVINSGPVWNRDLNFVLAGAPCCS